MSDLTRREWRRLLIPKVAQPHTYLFPESADVQWSPGMLVVKTQRKIAGPGEWRRGWVRGQRANGDTVTRMITESDETVDGELRLHVAPDFPETPLAHVEVLRAPLTFELFDDALERSMRAADVLMAVDEVSTVVGLDDVRTTYPLPDWLTLTQVAIDEQRVGGDRLTGMVSASVTWQTVGRPGFPAAVAQQVRLAAPSGVSAVLVPLVGGPTPYATGVVQVRIETDSGGLPSGTVVDGGSATMEAAALPTEIRWTGVTFGRTPLLAADTPYWLVVQPPPGSASSFLVWAAKSDAGALPTASYGTSWSSASFGPMLYRLVGDRPVLRSLSLGRGEWSVDRGGPQPMVRLARGRGLMWDDGTPLWLAGQKEQEVPTTDAGRFRCDSDWLLTRATAELAQTASMADRLQQALATAAMQLTQATEVRRRVSLRGTVVKRL